MGNCNSTICSGSDQPIQADPDIAGPGVRIRLHILMIVSRATAYATKQVIAAFLATAVLTFVAITVGYLSDSLPDATLTDFDRACLAKLPKMRVLHSKLPSPIVMLLRNTTSLLIAANRTQDLAKINQSLDPDEKRRQNRKRRSKGVERFILALSDQQLVTGLAVLIAGFFDPCSRSLYHFNIIASLGWFSSTCHLSTLSVLRIYLIEHPRVRDWRVAAMALIFCLLFVAQLITYSTNDLAAPVQCAYEKFSPGPLTFEFAYFLLAMPSVAIFLIVAYSNRIGRLYLIDPDWTIVNWLISSIGTIANQGRSVSNLQEIIIATANQPHAERSNLCRRVRQRRHFAHHCVLQTGSDRSLLRWFNRLSYLYGELSGSFLGEILTLVFGVTYGVTQLLYSRLDIPSVGLSGDQNSMGFGQLVPLLLILLPILAAGEVYFERHDSANPLPNAPIVKVDTPFDDVTSTICKILESAEIEEPLAYRTIYVSSHSIGYGRDQEVVTQRPNDSTNKNIGKGKRGSVMTNQIETKSADINKTRVPGNVDTEVAQASPG